VEESVQLKRIPFGVGFCLILVLAVNGQSNIGQSKSLSVNPILLWNAFLVVAIECDVAVDGSGNVYVMGDSSATWGSPIRPFSDSGDAFVAKLDSSGALQWNTFLGGDGLDMSSGETLAIDGSGNVYATGTSNSTWGSPIRAHSGTGCDAFVAKLDSSGALLWNTFLGGDTPHGDFGRGIAVDGSGNVCVTGDSYGSWGNPIRPFYVVGNGNNYTGFVAKLDSSGALQWNTFLGGGYGDAGMDIAIGGAGDVYVAGNSASTWGRPIRSYSGAFIGDDDVFVAKLNSSGALQWNTFLGGKGSDEGRAIAIDGSGNVCITGWSAETWGRPICPYSGKYNNTFTAKLASSGALKWNTFLAGVDDSALGFGIAADISGNVYITGRYGVYYAQQYAFEAKLNSRGLLQWNNIFGDAYTHGSGIAVDSSGYVYAAGTSQSTWGNPIQPFPPVEGATIFVAKFIQPSITVTSPAGGEAWVLDTTQGISWTSNGVSGNVNINLIKGASNLGAIATKIPASDGFYNWKSGYLKNGIRVAEGSDYLISVASADAESVKAISDGFFSLVKSRISVTSPVNGTIWNRNSVQRIAWTYKGVSGAVDIFLYRYGVLKGTIASAVPVSDLGCSWTVGTLSDSTTVPVGAGYSIAVKSADKKVVGKSRGTFTIKR
jgi:hypothetical protein